MLPSDNDALQRGIPKLLQSIPQDENPEYLQGYLIGIKEVLSVLLKLQEYTKPLEPRY